MTETQVLRLAEVRAAAASGEAQRIRVSAQLSIGEVASACGVDQSTVWRWERGARRPRGKGALAYGELIRSLRAAANNAEISEPAAVAPAAGSSESDPQTA